MKSKTPAEWKAILNWTKAALDKALRSGGVVAGTSPADEELLDVLERLAALHDALAASGEWRSLARMRVFDDKPAEPTCAGMSPDGRTPELRTQYDLMIATLIDEARTNPVSFDALRHHGANLLLESIWLMPALQRFLVSVLRGEIKAPRRRGRQQDVRARGIMIAAVTQDVVDRFGLPPMRNETPEEGQSACDAVAQAMRAMRLSPASYYRIKKIWLARDWS